MLYYTHYTMNQKFLSLALALPIALLTSMTSHAQTAQDSTKMVIDQLLGELNGPLGKKRDWNKVASLFVPQANIMIATAKGPRVMAFNDIFGPKGDSTYGKIQFLEVGLDHRITVDKSVATVHQPYRCDINGKTSHTGTNVYNMLRTPQGWKISFLMWYQEKAK